MNLEEEKEKKVPRDGFLIGLHSCSETLGVAIINSKDPKESLISSTFPIGRSLSNLVFNCINQVIPKSNWKQIIRIAVATGPGSFTSTRVTVAIARTLAQQVNCYLDGVSSFALMAARLNGGIEICDAGESFWITRDMPRRGLIAGEYIVKKSRSIYLDYDVIEISPPKLYSKKIDSIKSYEATENVSKDVERLTRICFASHELNIESYWGNILPIYPTSPVGNVK